MMKQIQNKYCLITALMILLIEAIFRTCTEASEFERKHVKMWETIEWSFKNSTYKKNPFDLSAIVRFKSENADRSITTKMFYAGDNIWKFRFTANYPGKWGFITESDDPELDKHTGTIEVRNNSDPEIKGFLTHKGNQFAIWNGNSPSLEAYHFFVYMNEKKFQNFVSKLAGKPYSESPFFKFKDNSRIEAYLHNAKRNGFEIVFIHPGYPQVWTNRENKENEFNPRLETFDILEKIITAAHKKGMRVHIWMWGDEARSATPRTFGLRSKGKIFERIEHKFPNILFKIFGIRGINGRADRRLQRYIAARLGPLPGWSMGYGFDLHEWVSQEELNSWATYLHQEFGWNHLLSARGVSLKGSNNIKSYDGFGRNVTLATSKYGPKDYHEISSHLTSDTSQPHLYEERHSYKRRNFNLDMQGSRRLIWRLTMAGGMGGWFGFYAGSEYPYPNPEQFRTVNKFWENRLKFDMIPGMAKSGELLLSSHDQKLIVAYKENTDDMYIDLPNMTENLKIVAVDTKKEYKEVLINKEWSKENRIRFQYKSDWVICADIIH